MKKKINKMFLQNIIKNKKNKIYIFLCLKTSIRGKFQ